VVFAALIGVWGHRYLPLQLYDPKVGWVQAGDHPLDWRYVATSIGGRIDYASVTNIITDEKYVTSLIVPVEQWAKIEVVGMKGVRVTDGSLLLVLRDLDIRRTYVEQAISVLYDPTFDRTTFRSALQRQAVLVYSSGRTELWLGIPVD
jgi:hypothetical protein